MVACAGELFLFRKDLRRERHHPVAEARAARAAVRLLSTNTEAVNVRACVRVYARRAESDSSHTISLSRLLALAADATL